MRCLVKSSNERNPCCQLPAREGGDSGETAQINWEEGGDDVRSVWPLCPGLHTYYNAQYRGGRSREAEEILKTGPSSDCRLQPAYTKPESLVMAHQLRRREYVPGSCTHRPSHHGSRSHPKYLKPTARRQGPKVRLVTGMKSCFVCYPRWEEPKKWVEVKLLPSYIQVRCNPPFVVVRH